MARPSTVAAPKPTRADPRTARQAKRAARVAERQAREAERAHQARLRAEAKAGTRSGAAVGAAAVAAETAGASDPAGTAPTVTTPRVSGPRPIVPPTITVPAAAAAASVPGADAGSGGATMVRRGRRVQRVVRRIDLWTVLKLSLVLYTCLYVAILLALVGLWALAYSTGQISNLQSFLGDVGLKNYRFYGDQMFRACAAIGGVGVLAGTLVTVLTVGMINGISELTGGIRFVIIEEDVGPPT